MQAMKELWTETEKPELRNTYVYVLDLCNRLEGTCTIARKSLNEAQTEYKHHYVNIARASSLTKRDNVLVHLQTTHNKFMLQ